MSVKSGQVGESQRKLRREGHEWKTIDRSLIKSLIEFRSFRVSMKLDRPGNWVVLKKYQGKVRAFG